MLNIQINIRGYKKQSINNYGQLSNTSKWTKYDTKAMVTDLIENSSTESNWLLLKLGAWPKKIE